MSIYVLEEQNISMNTTLEKYSNIEKIAELKYHIDNIKFLKFLKCNALFKIPYYPIFQIHIQYLEYHIL